MTHEEVERLEKLQKTLDETLNEIGSIINTAPPYVRERAKSYWWFAHIKCMISDNHKHDQR